MSLSDDIARDLAAEPKVRWVRRPEVLQHPNIPKPMHGMAPRVVLEQVWWDLTRRAARIATDDHCAACGIGIYEIQAHPFLEGHELFEIDYPAGRMTYRETVPLCYYCHGFIHDGRMERLRRAGKISTPEYEGIMVHGRRVLRAAQLKVPKPYVGPTPAWGAWRLVVFGVEYPPRFADYEAWEAFWKKGGDET
jgi:hypothetical protein